MKKRPIRIVGAIGYVPLAHGRGTALIDAADAELIGKFNWKLHSGGYAMTKVFGVSVYMHRMILSAGPEIEVDHRFRNRLDNRRHVLRLATESQNQHNRKKSQGTSSKYKGVCWSRQAGKWAAMIRDGAIGNDGKRARRTIGLFHSEEAAARAYDQAATAAFGEFAAINFQTKGV